MSATTYYDGTVNAREQGTPRGSVRQLNLAEVVRLLHFEGSLSRAALTEHTGLNRSTIADLIAQLGTWELVTEREPDIARGVGRPSPIVSLSPETVAITVNPEVDALTIAAIGIDRAIIVRDRVQHDTVPTPAETAALIAKKVSGWRAGPLALSRIIGIGLAVPGLVRASDGLVRDAPHLGWRDVPLAEVVAAATELPVSVGNDATLGALAEHLFGAASGIDHAIYLNGGASGIGGGLIIGGMPVAGAGGYAGEFGQNRPGIAHDHDRRAPGGVLEDEVSRARLLEVLQLTDADEPTLATALTEATGAVVAGEVTRQRGILTTALANAVNVLNPSVIVLGGFLATLAGVDLEGLTAAVRQQAMPASGEHLQIRAASLAENRLLIGAAELAFAPLLEDPSRAS